MPQVDKGGVPTVERSIGPSQDGSARGFFEYDTTAEFTRNIDDIGSNP